MRGWELSYPYSNTITVTYQEVLIPSVLYVRSATSTDETSYYLTVKLNIRSDSNEISEYTLYVSGLSLIKSNNKDGYK